MIYKCFMKRLVFIILTQLFVGCSGGNQRATQKEVVDSTDIVVDCLETNMKANHKDSCVVLFNQPCEGFEVVVNYHDDVDGGRAWLHFKSKSKSFSVYCEPYVFPYDKNVYPFESKVDDDTIRVNYVAPEKDEYLSESSPFYFKDMDFDGEKELVVTGFHIGYYNSNQYYVFKVLGRKTPMRLTEEPFVWAGQPMCSKWTEYLPEKKVVKCYFSSGGELIKEKKFEFAH